MLTSPVNVTIAANGATLKPHATPADTGARREPLPPTSAAATPSPSVIEPELPSQSPMTSVNAVTATAAGRTILQDLSLQVATMLRLARRPDENMTALFIRIIATIEGMPQAERLQFEVRTGLKSQKITLADLAMALRDPDGIEAARLTAIAEAPAAVPGKTAVAAATTTYLQEGTADGHAEETLAMRAAARNSAAGQNVFSADTRGRHAEPQPMDAKALQSQLKSMFEPGSARSSEQEASWPRNAQSAKSAVVPTPLPTPLPMPTDAETVTISTSHLRLDAAALEKIRNMAQTIAEDLPEALAEPKTPATDEDPQPIDRRLQTMLTLKGLAEVVAALPAKAAELLGAVPQDRPPPSPPAALASMVEAPAEFVDLEALPAFASPGEEVQSTEKGVAEPVPAKAAELLGAVPQDRARPSPPTALASMVEAPAEFVDLEALPAFASPGEEVQSTEKGVAEPLSDEVAAETTEDIVVPSNGRKAAASTEAARPEISSAAASRSDPAQFAVPFAYAQLSPVRETAVEAPDEEETRDRHEDDSNEDEEDAPGEKRRPRDEYDAIHDPEPEEEPSIRITRDSSEADRAFALYQRMGGF